MVEMHTRCFDSLLPRQMWRCPAGTLRPSTMDDRRFALMKDGSYLLNVGVRSVDQVPWVRAAETGKLAAPALMSPFEPARIIHGKQENLLLTPHISDFSICGKPTTTSSISFAIT